MHFGENQLSRSLIGLSPLTTGHPPTFQRWWVRSSTQSYPRFNLPMARSPRFGSRTRDSTPSSDSLSLRLPHHRLTSPHATNSQAHSSKGTPSPAHRTNRRQALTDCRRTVSGTISLPSRGTFHHSLTVLVRYRSPGSIQPYQVVLADSQQILGVRCYSGTFQKTMRFRLPGSHRLRPAFPHCSTNNTALSLLRRLSDPPRKAPQPRIRNP
jgi:hypothetical protein